MCRRVERRDSSIDSSWKLTLAQERRTPPYTTCWEEVPVVRA
ncbi:MAG: DUF4113 domain-containing protein [Methylophilaceae bacterium]